MDEQFDNIESLYFQTKLQFNKGTILKTKVSLDTPLEDFERQNLGPFIDRWTFALEGKDIRPFRLVSFETEEKSFTFVIEIKKKTEGKDELKLLCQDIINFFNCFYVHVLKWEHEELV
jgi:hypothetical protein